VTPHEAFLKAIRVEPNDPLHERIYGDFLRDEGYDPPDEYIRQARALAPMLHSAKRSLIVPFRDPLGLFGLELLLSCRRLDAMQELYLAGRCATEDGALRVIPNIGERGVIRLIHAPLMEQITRLDVRFNNLRDEGVDALVAAPGLGCLQELLLEEPEHPFTADQWVRLEQRFCKRLKRPRMAVSAGIARH
jgi:hypothetical protein